MGLEPERAAGWMRLLRASVPRAVPVVLHVPGRFERRPRVGLAVDAAANTYVTGWTSSTNFPVLGGVQAKLSGSRDAFVAKLNPSGNALIYSTYLGGSGVDTGNGIALDTNNSAVIVGDTTSTNLATTPGVLQRRTAGGQDTFVPD